MTTALGLVLACGLFAASAEPQPLEGRVVELNQATLEELQRLPGIGPRKAEAIVELRKKRPFTRVTQLLEVKGVGRKTLERLKPWVRVTPLPSALPASGGRAPSAPGGPAAAVAPGLVAPGSATSSPVPSGAAHPPKIPAPAPAPASSS